MDKTLNMLIRDITNMLFKKFDEIRYDLLDLYEQMKNTISNSDSLSKDQLISELEIYHDSLYKIKSKIDDLT